MLIRNPPLREVSLMWPNIKLLVSLAGEGMVDGERSRQELCPACYGGQTKEKAFSIYRSGGQIYFKCFRASCGIHGMVDVHGTLHDRATELAVNREKRRPLLESVESIPSDVYRYLLTKYGLFHTDFSEAGVMYTSMTKRVAFPVGGPLGITQHRGWNNRTWRDGEKKWDAYREAWDEPWQAWYCRPFIHKTEPLIIVEDQISAIKVSRSYSALALLGTILDLEKVLEIGRYSGNRAVLLALDKDATSKAIAYIDEFKFFTNNNFHLLSLEQDIKDMPAPEFRLLVEGVIGD